MHKGAPRSIVTEGRQFVVRAYLHGRVSPVDVFIGEHLEAIAKTERIAQEGLWLDAYHFVPPSHLLWVEIVEDTTP